MLPFLSFLWRIIVVEKSSDTITSNHMAVPSMEPTGVDNWVLQLLPSVGVVSISMAEHPRVTVSSVV